MGEFGAMNALDDELDPAAVTQWLQQLGAARPEVSSQLFERLYTELKRLARSHLRREAPATRSAPRPWCTRPGSAWLSRTAPPGRAARIS